MDKYGHKRAHNSKSQLTGKLHDDGTCDVPIYAGDVLKSDVYISVHVLLGIGINSLECFSLSEANSSSFSQYVHHISWNRVQNNASFPNLSLYIEMPSKQYYSFSLPINILSTFSPASTLSRNPPTIKFSFI